MLLLIGQTILGPIGMISASADVVSPTTQEASQICDDTTTDEDGATTGDTAQVVTSGDTAGVESGEGVVPECLKAGAQQGFAPFAAVKAPIQIDNLEIGTGDKAAEFINGKYHLDVDKNNLLAQYYLSFDFTLPENHTSNPGDYFEFEVDPAAFELTQENGIIEDGGTKIADFTIETTGKITITFSDAIAGGAPVDNGRFSHAWALVANAQKGDLVTDYVFNIDGAKTFTLAVDNPGGKPLDKSSLGVIGDVNEKNPTAVKWQVDVNTDTKDISSLSLEDILTVVPGSIIVIELEPQITGNPKEGTDTGGWSYKNNDNNFPINFDNSKKAYRITYETEITDAQREAAITSGTRISNTATLGTEFDSANQSVTFDKPISKSAGNYTHTGAAGGLIEWTIKVNADGRDISGGVTVKDTLTLTGEDSADGNRMKIDGNPVITPAVVSNSFIEQADGTFTVTFVPAAANKTAEHTITYTTKDTVVDQSYKVSNKAELWYGNAISGSAAYDAKPEPNNVSVNHRMLTKTGQTGDAIDYLAKTIDWTVNFNASGYSGLNPVVITDTFDSDGKYFRMYKDEFETKNTALMNDFTLAPLDGKSWSNENDGKGDYTSDGFKLEANKIINQSVSFTYPTHFDSTVDYTNNTITNGVGVVWKKDGQEYKNDTSFSSTFNTFTANNGKKTGVYNPIDKTVEWELDVNYKEHTLPTAKIVDSFGDKQTMATVDKNTIKVELLDMAATPTVNSDFLNYTVTGTGPAGNYTGFELNFGETINKAYRVTYTTKYNEQFIGEFSDQANKAKNTAKFTSEGDKVTDYDTSDLNTSPGVTNAGEYFKKEGRDIANKDYLEWKFAFNKSQSHIKTGSTIEDILNDGQVLVEDFTGLTLDSLIRAGRGTFEIKKRTYTRNGNNFSNSLGLPLTQAEVDELFKIEIAEDKKSFMITLKRDIDHEYEISYVTNISAAISDKLSNEYTYKFNGTKTDTEKITTDVTYQWNDASGSLRTYTLKLNKKDAVDGTKLEDVEFELYINVGANSTLVKSGKTDEHGVIDFGTIKYGNYTLKETNPKTGYSNLFQVGSDPALKSEYTFQTTGTGAAQNISLEIKNTLKQGDVIITKQDADTKEKLSGAVFEIYHDNNGVKGNIVITVPTGTDGTVTVPLPPGNYIAVEKTPPAGYAPPENNLFKFTIDLNPDSDKIVTVENKIKPGSVIFEKVDSRTGDGLSGAEFNILDVNDEVVHSFTTETAGKYSISDFRPGKYKLVETKAPAGYQKTTSVTNFEISLNPTETVFVPKVENTAIPVDIMIKKIDDNTKAGIEGAKFTLTGPNPDNTVNRTIITEEDGTVNVGKLPPGEYVLTETEAPAGYELPANQVTTFTVEVANTEDKLSHTQTVENTAIPGDMVIKKFDKNNVTQLLASAEFQVKDSAGEPVKNSTGDTITVTTDVNGKAEVKGLAPGDYTLVETKAPTGYYKLTQPVPFTIKVNQKEALELSVGNIKIPPYIPGNPGTPGEPSSPGTPGEPGNPEKPIDPNKPGDKEEPNKPVDPIKPDDKENPNKPGNPDVPGTPDEPGNQGNPGNPGTPGESTPNPKDPSNVGAGNEQGEGGKPGKDNTAKDPNASVHGSGGENAEGGLLGKDGKPNSQVANSGGEKATLPQTGEQSMLYMMIFGFALILMGGVMVACRKTNE